MIDGIVNGNPMNGLGVAKCQSPRWRRWLGSISFEQTVTGVREDEHGNVISGLAQ